MSDDLEVLAPQGASVKFRGRTMEVLPIRVGALPKLVREARPVIDRLLELEALPADDDPGGLVTLVLDLIEHHGERVFAAAAICTGEDQAFVEGGDIEEFAVLAQAIVEVNKDFFAQRLAPLLAGRAASAATGGGPTPSSSSSSAGTA